ncbi:hypothetical protein [Alkaliphilus peptidifermentans]|uniref:Uncharacterized protein n=1 Tax=Alkaliphilus peptidifermentans DSM 18978 TaxID=1120976 RepID=A0A1G5L1M0_9FIRM|nr:hypothetical protein [Alkaliphilus peptidifermentans]SCZ06278.1 hypothetical protein SAMN03080606_03932 [Alkaliphilus peptidifermentans DSM 18978]
MDEDNKNVMVQDPMDTVPMYPVRAIAMYVLVILMSVAYALFWKYLLS